jgi:2-oxoglutarate dehydrogenase E2 component (dihydrolipoamide succinyltransferase)
MALINMTMPRMGESIMECTVIQWLKQPGDRIEADESLLEVATDKVDTEVPAVEAGVLVEILVQPGDVVPIGDVIARIETEVMASGSTETAPDLGTGTIPSFSANGDHATNGIDTEAAEIVHELEMSMAALSSHSVSDDAPAYSVAVTLAAVTAADFGDRFYSPLVLNIAKEEGLSRAELNQIPGTGAANRLTKQDILGYISGKSQVESHRLKVESQKSQVETGPPGGQKSKVENQAFQTLGTMPDLSAQPKTENGNPKIPAGNRENPDIIQMDRMRKLIAQRMLESVQTSPHVTSFVEADMTSVVEWRTRTKDTFKQQTGENLTFTPILVEAIVRAIKDFPMINVSVKGDTIIVKKQINVGMAVALPSGNLIVPVIHNADQYNLVGLAKQVNDLTARARANKLTADDLAGGTYTISNIGTFGNLMGTPIIVQPQVAIMAFGAIVKKPAVIETPQGDFIGIRQLMFLSHSYDHRVVDGALGGQFIRRVADYLEQFDTTRIL